MRVILCGFKVEGFRIQGPGLGGVGFEGLRALGIFGA